MLVQAPYLILGVSNMNSIPGLYLQTVIQSGRAPLTGLIFGMHLLEKPSSRAYPCFCILSKHTLDEAYRFRIPPVFMHKLQPYK